MNEGDSVHKSVLGALRQCRAPDFVTRYASFYLNGHLLGSTIASVAIHEATVRVRWRGCRGGGKKRDPEQNAKHCKESRAKAVAKELAVAARNTANIRSMLSIGKSAAPNEEQRVGTQQQQRSGDEVATEEHERGPGQERQRCAFDADGGVAHAANADAAGACPAELREDPPSMMM